ncbi:MAG: PcfJ domain-containing protein, partial [Clostridia bacterium]
KKLREVKSLNSYFVGMSFEQVRKCFIDENYRNFVTYVANKCNFSVSNTGTILAKLPHYSSIESYFAAGLKVGGSTSLCKPMSLYPKDILKMIRECDYPISYNFERSFLENKDMSTKMARYAAQQDYSNMRKRTVLYIISTMNNRYNKAHKFIQLVDNFNYDYKRLMDYLIVELDDIEAIGWEVAISDLFDYSTMSTHLMGGRVTKIDKYPRYLRTTHDIVVRNYNHFKLKYDEEIFANSIDKSLEFEGKEYKVIVPKCVDDLKQEGVTMSSCVGSYVNRIMKKESQVCFMRRNPSESLVTLEVSGKTIVQAKRKYNTQITIEDKKFLEVYSKEKGLKIANRL